MGCHESRSSEAISARALPALNPNQPTHNSAAPITLKGRLCGGIASAIADPPFSVIGAALLWVGWFGFNAGSALAADGLATSAFVATHIATSAAALFLDGDGLDFPGKPTVLGAASGAVAGLVAITPASGFVGPISAIWIGIAGGVLCSIACSIKPKLGYDDSLDVVGVHGVGVLGERWQPAFSLPGNQCSGNDGLFFGNQEQLWVQFVAVVATWILALSEPISSYPLLGPLRVSGCLMKKNEWVLDLSQHDERAYE